MTPMILNARRPSPVRPFPRRARLSVLLTRDEARRALGRSTFALLSEARSDPRQLWALLWGLPATELDPADRELAAAYRRTLGQITAAGHASIIDDELEGICSATGLDAGELADLDVIAQTVGDEADDDRWAI